MYTQDQGAPSQEQIPFAILQELHGQGLLSLSKSNLEMVNDFSSMDTVFALSNDPSSDAYGTTCFGQDVAAYTDIVTVMVSRFSLHFKIS